MKQAVLLKNNICMVVLIYNKEFLILGIHPCPSAQNQKQKNLFII